MGTRDAPTPPMITSPESPFPPLPGTEQPVRGLFVDRWGTLLQGPPRYAFDPERFVPGAVDALFRAQQVGWTVYLIGNEDAVARGRVSNGTWKRFEEDLLGHLCGHGVMVARNYACLEHPDGRSPHGRPSVFLLPDTGLLYHAAQVDAVHLGRSWVIGDSSLELTAGGRAGCRTLGVRTGEAFRDGFMEVEPDAVAEDLTEALMLLTQSAAQT
jgi:D-glycero-D-manno-heptose 1,7-bisphosphate phosphatase